MVLVAVGNQNAFDFVGIFQNISKIGDNEVNAEHFRVGERKPAIDQQHVAVALIKRHVFADFVKAAQESNL